MCNWWIALDAALSFPAHLYLSRAVVPWMRKRRFSPLAARHFTFCASSLPNLRNDGCCVSSIQLADDLVERGHLWRVQTPFSREGLGLRDDFSFLLMASCLRTSVTAAPVEFMNLSDAKLGLLCCFCKGKRNLGVSRVSTCCAPTYHHFSVALRTAISNRFQHCL